MRWLAAGLPELEGVHDVAPIDIDNDGDLDLVIGRCDGTRVYMNQRNKLGSDYCQDANTNSEVYAHRELLPESVLPVVQRREKRDEGPNRRERRLEGGRATEQRMQLLLRKRRRVAALLHSKAVAGAGGWKWAVRREALQRRRVTGQVRGPSDR